MDAIVSRGPSLANGSDRPETFATETHGKWILLGEHSVLRGCPALAFPVYGKSLTLSWNGRDSKSKVEPFQAHFHGERGQEFQLLFTGVFDRGLELLNRPNDQSLKFGRFDIESTLPVGAGLGASAALAVGVGRWFVAMSAIEQSKLFDFCRELENLFHGESSGVDVAVAIESKGLKFQRGVSKEASESKPARLESFDTKWQPFWYISSSGARGITSECVSKVKSWMATHPDQGERVDQLMRDAVLRAEKALMQEPSESAFTELAESIEMGAECFVEWGLSGGELGHHMQWLREQGAAAVKPTGSGGGGFALSLWRNRPRLEVESQLIPVFRVDHA